MRKWVLLFALFIIIFFGVLINVYFNAVEPVKLAEEEVTKLAKDETDLKEVDDFNLYHGSQVYYVIKGKDQNGEKIIVWISEKNGDVFVINEKDGITKSEAIQKLKEEKNPEEIMSVRLGMENNIPLWEIYYRSNNNLINYYYVDFESGEWLKKIENL